MKTPLPQRLLTTALAVGMVASLGFGAAPHAFAVPDPNDDVEVSETEPSVTDQESVDGAVPETDTDGVGAVDAVTPAGSADSLTAAPSQVEVQGTIMVVPHESSRQEADDAVAGHTHGDPAHEEASEEMSDAVFLATNAGPVLEVAAGLASSIARPGEVFVGEVPLPVAAQEAVAEGLAERSQLSVDDALELAVEAMDLATPAEDAELMVTGGHFIESQAGGSAAAAPSSAAHSLDVVYYNNQNRKFSRSDIEQLVARVSSYWQGQSESKIAGISVRTFQVDSSKTKLERCNASQLWVDTAGKNGRTVESYVSRGQQGQHLVALVDDDCGAEIGFGTYGILHGGGAVWVNLSSNNPNRPIQKSVSLLAHEIGHNLGLDHANLRVCPDRGTAVVSTSDTAVNRDSGYGDWQLADRSCYEEQYGDSWSVMGYTYADQGDTPQALGISQKDSLQVLGSESLRRIDPSGGMVQSYEISGVGQSTGLRGVQVASPAPGEDFYIEYRNGRGQDSGMPWSSADVWWSFWGRTASFATGVQIVKPKNRIYNGNYVNYGFPLSGSVVIPNYSMHCSSGNVGGGCGWGLGNALRTGNPVETNESRPYGDTVRVTVLKQTADTATVRVEFKGFQRGTRSVMVTADKVGSLDPGTTLMANMNGSWQVPDAWRLPASATDSFQWLRNGQPIPNATSANYAIVEADYGANISVRVTPSAPGFLNGESVTSATVKVSEKPVEKPPVEPEKPPVEPEKPPVEPEKPPVVPEKPPVVPEKPPVVPEKPPVVVAPRDSFFADVTLSDKFSTEINWMYSSGLSTGTRQPSGKPKYLPADSLTREAMAAFMYRLNTPKGAKAPEGYTVPKTSPFADVPTSHKFYKEIAWMHRAGLSTGTKQASGKPMYAPSAALSRGAMAAFLYRLEARTDVKVKNHKSPASSPFADVNRTTKFYREIAWMHSSGLSTGTRQSTGKPRYEADSSLSRSAMAAFLYRRAH